MNNVDPAVAAKLLYISIEDLAAQITAIRTQLGGKVKVMDPKALQMQLVSIAVKKKFAGPDGKEVLKWAVLRTQAEPVLAAERTAKFSKKHDFKRVAKPAKPGVTKAGDNLRT